MDEGNNIWNNSSEGNSWNNFTEQMPMEMIS
jgi:hypothetical protein